MEFLSYMKYKNARALETVCDAQQHQDVFKLQLWDSDPPPPQ